MVGDQVYGAVGVDTRSVVMVGLDLRRGNPPQPQAVRSGPEECRFTNPEGATAEVIFATPVADVQSPHGRHGRIGWWR